MLRTKFKYENKQRAITQKLSKQELQFMCTAFPLDDIYPPQNFITIASIVLEIRTGQSSSIKIKGNDSKTKQTRVTVHVHNLMRSIHPQNFITIASIVLEICSGQNSNMKINKGQ